MWRVAFAVGAAAALVAVALVFAGREPPRPGPSVDAVPAAAAVADGADATASRADAAPAAPAGARGTIDGVLVDAAGLPVADAEVVCVDLAHPDAVSAATRTDARGAFALAGQPAGPLRVVATHRAFLVVNEPVAVAARRGLRLVAHRRPVVRGRVVDARGVAIARFCAALAGVAPGAQFAALEPPPGAVWWTRDDGAFELAARQAGPHVLAVFTERGAPAQVRLDLAVDGVVERDVAVVPGVRVRGVVRASDGAAVAGARVTLRAVPGGGAVFAATGADGTFALPVVAGGDHELAVEPDDQPCLRRAGLRLDAAEPEPFFELQLPAAASARGTVRPWRAGQTAVVVFSHRDGPQRRAPVDDASGTFAIAGLTPGVHAVFVERTEANWRARVAHLLADRASAPQLDLAAGAEGRIDPVDPVATMARVHGIVAGAAQPERLAVRAVREDAPLPERAAGLFRAVPDAAGAYEVDALLPGRWRLQLMAGVEVLAWEAVDVPPSGDLELVLRVPKGGR